MSAISSIRAHTAPGADITQKRELPKPWTANRRTNMCGYIYIYIHAYTNIPTYVFIYIYKHVCMCVYIHILTHTHIYVHIKMYTVCADISTHSNL